MFAKNRLVRFAQIEFRIFLSLLIVWGSYFAALAYFLSFKYQLPDVVNKSRNDFHDIKLVIALSCFLLLSPIADLMRKKTSEISPLKFTTDFSTTKIALVFADFVFLLVARVFFREFFAMIIPYALLVVACSLILFLLIGRLARMIFPFPYGSK